MALTVITYPHTFVDGETHTAAQHNGNFSAIKTALETDKLGTSNLQNPNALFPIVMTVDSLIQNEVVALKFKTPAFVLTPILATLCADKIAVSPQLSLRILNGAANIFSVPGDMVSPAPYVADTLMTTAAFSPTTIAASSTLTFEFSELSNGAGDLLEEIVAVLWCKSEHVG